MMFFFLWPCRPPVPCLRRADVPERRVRGQASGRRREGLRRTCPTAPTPERTPNLLPGVTPFPTCPRAPTPERTPNLLPGVTPFPTCPAATTPERTPNLLPGVTHGIILP